jgi:hypothetical protein
MLGGVESPTTNSVSLGLGCIPTAKQNLAYRYCSWENLTVTHFPPYPLFWIHILVAQITFCFWLNRHFRCFNHHFCWSNHSVRCQKHKSSDYGSNHSFLVDKSTIIIIISLFLMLRPPRFSYYIPIIFFLLYPCCIPIYHLSYCFPYYFLFFPMISLLCPYCFPIIYTYIFLLIYLLLYPSVSLFHPWF